TLASNISQALVGQAVTFTATVVGQASGSNPPQGTVDFFDGSQLLGSVPFTNGTATLTTATLGEGVHNITARFNGFALGAFTWSASQSNSAQVAIAAPPQTASPPALSNSVVQLLASTAPTAPVVFTPLVQQTLSTDNNAGFFPASLVSVLVGTSTGE